MDTSISSFIRGLCIRQLPNPGASPYAVDWIISPWHNGSKNLMTLEEQREEHRNTMHKSLMQYGL